MHLKQIIPQGFCHKCEICCRFPAKNSVLAPYFSAPEIERAKAPFIFLPRLDNFRGTKANLANGKNCFFCPFFNQRKNSCRIYAARPFDCQLYPFMVTYDENLEKVVLCADRQCPFIEKKLSTAKSQSYLKYLQNFLEENADWFLQNFNFINLWQPTAQFLKDLPRLSEKLFGAGLGLKKLTLNQQSLFADFLQEKNHSLSSYAFPGIYVWSDFFHFLWKVVDHRLCLFAHQPEAGLFFLYLPPLGKTFSRKSVQKACILAQKLNQNRQIWVNCIEKEEKLSWKNLRWQINPAPRGKFRPYPAPARRSGACVQERGKAWGFTGGGVKQDSQEYLGKSTDWANLKGNRYKDKRALYNFFCRNYQATFRTFKTKDLDSCLELYQRWAKEKREKVQDDYFFALLEDSLFMHRRAMLDRESLRIKGWVVEIEKRISAYSLGYALNPDTFVILAEITAPKTKGLAQFIFRQVCQALVDYPQINIMDDAGLENLRQVKLSYRPEIIKPVYSAYLV
jgi:Fe-S-cluster containining protein